MKRVQKTAVAFVALALVLIVTLNYVYQEITPRAVGTTPFPLERLTRYCVGEQIREISAGGTSTVLVNTDNSLSVYDLINRKLIWSASIKSQGETFPAVSAGERVFVSDNTDLWAFDLKTGSRLWTEPLDGHNSRIPDASERFMLLNTVSGSIETYDVRSGIELWKTAGGRGYTPAFVDGNKIYMVDRGIKELDGATGQLLWQASNNRATGPGWFSSGLLYYVEYLGNQTIDLVAFSTETKSELWRKSFSDNGLKRIYKHNKFLFMTMNNVLYEINAENGETNWVKNLSDPTNLSFIDEGVYVLEQFHRIVRVLDIRDGRELGALRISIPKIIDTRAQEMVAVGRYLVFSRGCEVFIYGP